MDIAEGIALIISVIALTLSWRAHWVSKHDRKQDRQEQFIRLSGETKIEMAKVDAAILVLGMELGLLEQKWEYAGKEAFLARIRNSMTTTESAQQTMREALKTTEENKASYSELMGELLNCKLSAQASLITMLSTTETVRSALADIEK